MKYRRVKIWGIAAVIMVMLGMAGCGGTPALMESDPAAASEPNSAAIEEVSPTLSTSTAAVEESVDPESGDEANKLIYTDEQTKDILAAAREAGLHTVYVPTIGGGPDDYFDSVTVEGNRLTLHFIRMAIAESAEEIMLFGKDRIERTVQLADGLTGKWITQDESTVAYLYFRIDPVYFEFFSAKMFDGKAFEAAASSLVPLEDTGGAAASPSQTIQASSTPAPVKQVEGIEQQLRMLERAVSAGKPEEAVETWVRALFTRNGALQYAVLSPASRVNKLSYFEACNWVTGTSSPWMERYRIGAGKKQPDGSYIFQVKFEYRTSVDMNKNIDWADIEAFDVVVRKYGEFWAVEE